MTVDELRTIIAGGESERVEMTRAFDKADKIGQAVCAFANDFSDSGEAGILLLGVDNDGSIAGRRIEDQQLASLGGIAKVNRELEQAGNQPAQCDVNKKTEFRVTIIARPQKSGQINPESGQINPESGQMNSESGQINPESGRIKNVRSYDIKSQDDAVLCAIQDCPGIKADGIFLQIRTSTRSVRRSLERLSGASKIEYRGSKRTGGWYVRT